MSILPSVPSQTARRLADSLQHELSLYGYELIETPVIESAHLFLTRAGDQLINRLFTFERYGQQLALRPEFTAAAAQRYAKLDTTEVARWQFGGLVFEDDPGSRNYQHLSMSAELIGMDGPAADAEIVSLAVQGLVKQRFQDWQVVIGHTGLVRHLLALFGLDRRTERFLLGRLSSLQDPVSGKNSILEEFDRALMGMTMVLDEANQPENDEYTLNLTEISTHQMLNVLLDATQRGMTMGGRTRHDIARRLLHKHQRYTQRQQVVEALELLEQWVAIHAPAEEAFRTIESLLPASDEAGHTLLANWRKGVDLLTSFDIELKQVVIQPHVERNWDYYTGIVFEILTPDGVQLAGGGRYDELISLVGGLSVPAVGFAYYVDQILDCLTHETLKAPEPLVIVLNADNQQAASRLAHTLRSRDIPVILANKPDSGRRTLTVTADGRAQLHNQSYSSVDILIADILAGNV